MIFSLRYALLFGALFVAPGAFAQPPSPQSDPSGYAAWKQAGLAPSLAPLAPAPTAPAARGGLFIPYPGDGGWSELAPNDDGYTGMLDLGFTFSLYGTSFDQACFNNNGNLSFGPDDDSCYSTYSPEGFPSTEYVMVAPFWGDVDTGCATCGRLYYKPISVDGTAAYVAHWEAVGFYDENPSLTNTFQVVIAAAPVLLGTNNVCFGYADMQWTTGDASGGEGGFGGSPAVVGANRGNGTDYFLYGLFDHAGTDYDGPGGEIDGVSHLDGQTICFNTGGSATNVPPIASGFSNGEVFPVEVGSTFTRAFVFLSPEAGQTTSITVEAGGLAHFSATTTTGNTATATLTFTPDASQAGDHTVTLTATDDGAPPLATVVSVVLRVPSATDAEGSTQPAATTLAAAYPNPSAGTMTFPFSLGVAGPVRLVVHDVLGREVARLVDAPLPAGPHTATWDGRDAAGRVLPSGPYLVRLDAGGTAATQKLIRLR